MSHDRPQQEAAMETSRPPGPTLTRTERRENNMSLTEDASGVGLDPSPRRSRGERLAVIAGIVVTVLAVAGIAFLVTNSDADQPAPPLPTPAAQITTPPSLEPAPQTPADIAAAEAQERYREFIRVKDQVAQASYASPELYETVAINPERAQLIIEARQFAGARVTGETKIASLVVESVQLPTDPAEYPSVRLLACLDVTNVQAVDANGTSLVSPDRLDRIQSRVLLQKFKPGDFSEAPERSGWFVAEVEQRGEPC
jgi:hypothetical protein